MLSTKHPTHSSIPVATKKRKAVGLNNQARAIVPDAPCAAPRAYKQWRRYTLCRKFLKNSVLRSKMASFRVWHTLLLFQTQHNWRLNVRADVQHAYKISSRIWKVWNAAIKEADLVRKSIYLADSHCTSGLTLDAKTLTRTSFNALSTFTDDNKQERSRIKYIRRLVVLNSNRSVIARWKARHGDRRNFQQGIMQSQNKLKKLALLRWIYVFTDCQDRQRQESEGTAWRRRNMFTKNLQIWVSKYQVETFQHQLDGFVF